MPEGPPYSAPEVPLSLVLYLEEEYPPMDARPGDDLAVLVFQGGRRDLVKRLRAMYEEQSRPADPDPDPYDVRRRA